MADGFRIGRIVIEGFKGFTEPKEIDLKNRHVFLIGPNGNGKSSIIEAIRWGLFGSTNRPNENVRNRGYGGDCCVEIRLTRDGKEWRLCRTLTPGGGSNSQAELFDEHGKGHHIRDILPQMNSLDAGEGGLIIFAPQSVPLGLQPGDLAPFERTVLSHLDLSHARAMLSHLETSVEEQEEAETSLDSLVSSVRRGIDEEIKDLERQRGRILSSPPWESNLVPSTADTENRAKKLILAITKSEKGNDFQSYTPDALLGEAEKALQERIDLDRTPLEQEREGLEDQLARLQNVHSDWEGIVQKRKDREKAIEDMKQILRDTSLAELQKQVEEQRQIAKTFDLKRQLGVIADELLGREESEETIPCPICKTKQKWPELNCAVQAMISAESQDDLGDLLANENQLTEATQIDDCIRLLSQEIEESEIDLKTKISEDVELIEVIEEERMTDHIEGIEKQRDAVIAQIENFEGLSDGFEVEIAKLREEVRYQRLQRELNDLKAVDADVKLVQQEFKKLVMFGESVRHIRDSVKSTLMKELENKVPGVANELTNVFGALTKHPHFDQLVFDEKSLPHLKLRVTSSSDPSGMPQPTDVLNGQAQSALALVPYFALGQADEAPTEVYLVLLDDPTRAFDKEHIEILIERLAELGKRVQVIVATQEAEIFHGLLPKNFVSGSYLTIEPKDWSYADGPILVTKYG